MDLSSRKRDILIGLVVLVLIAGIFYLYKLQKPKLKVPENSAPTFQQVEQNLEGKFKFNVPDDVEKAQLTDVSGGDGSGIATRTEILADIADPAVGYFYQAWLEKNGTLVSLGKMLMEKGGWLITYNGSKYIGYNKVIISLEKTFDSKIEKRILEGSF